MAVRVDIYVNDITSVISSSFDQIKVYRSARRDSDYSEATSSSTRIGLLEDIARYSYNDIFGNADSWYKWSYYDSISVIETSLSDPLRGTVSGTVYRGASYPAEVYLSPEEQDTVYRIRQFIGDFKEVNRDYLSSATSYDNVSTDKYSVELDNPKGWPLNIEVDGTSYTSISEPIVHGYQFVTFSGTQINTVSGTVSIYYEHFRFSDREILDSYRTVEPPPPLSSSQATTGMYEILASIKILEGELRNFMATSSSAVRIEGEISINPEPGLRARQQDLESLRKKLADLVKGAVANNLTLYGVRIE